MYAEGFTVEVSGDVVLALAETKRHKVASTAERKTTLLPLMGLGRWFADDCWFSKWLDVMESQLGKPSDRKFVLPAYSEKAGKWLDRPMSPGEGTLWMRDIIEAKGVGYLVDTLTTHCLKTTRLASLSPIGSTWTSVGLQVIAWTKNFAVL